MTSAPGATATARNPARRGLGRRFAAFQGGVLSSDAADGLYRFAVPLLALTVTRSPSAVALVATATRLPWLLFGLPGGVLVDRYGPAAVMRWAGAVRTLLVLALMVTAWRDLLTVPVLGAGAVLVGTAGVLSDLAAQSWTPRLVPDEQLTRANSRIQSIQITMGQLFGPSLGGFLVQLGAFVPLLIATVGYLVSSLTAVLVPRMRGTPQTAKATDPRPRRQGRGAASAFRELREGLVHFARRRDVGRLAALGAVQNFAFAAMITLLPLWVVRPGPLAQSAAVLGLTVTGVALGGLAAGACGPRLIARTGPGAVLRVAAPLTGLGLALVAVPHLGAVVAGLVLYGTTVTLGNLVVVSYRQKTIPPELFGRVNAAYRWICWGAMPLGTAAAGVLSSWLGLSTAFALVGATAFLAALVLPPRGSLEAAEG